MNKILHIIPFYSENINSVPQDEKDNAGLWYLHGKLENIFKFDKAIITNCKTLGILKPFQYNDNTTFNKLYLNDVVDCEVEGVNEPCVGYFYIIEGNNDKSWIQRGLVCLKSDTTACQQAEKKMKEKAIIL